MLIQMVNLQGGEAIAKVSSKEKVERAKELGAAYAVNYRTHEYDKWIGKEIGKIDISYNPVGGSTFKKDASLMNSGGRMFLFGGSELGDGKWGVLSALNFVRKMGVVIPVGLMMNSRNILGVNMLKIADNKPEVLKSCLQGVIELYQSGKLTIPKATTYDHTDLGAAHRLLESGKSMGKIVILW